MITRKTLQLKSEMEITIISGIDGPEEDEPESEYDGDLTIDIISPSPLGQFFHRGKNTRNLTPAEIKDLRVIEIENAIAAFIRFHEEQLIRLQKWF